MLADQSMILEEMAERITSRHLFQDFCNALGVNDIKDPERISRTEVDNITQSTIIM